MRKQTGFTLIELLIVVAIIGIIAAIAIPNLLNAIDRGKQKRTMADLRSVGTACEEYQIDSNFYPRNFTTLAGVGTMSQHIEPVYIRRAPREDGWGWMLLYGSDAGGTGYTLRSPGKDGTTQAIFGETTDFDCDIIFQNGSFTAFPKGRQSD
jgi:general secretion pathway protein G